jgi:UDP-2-acetamido-3-amino-2,3-dideoxy-glucuronate N-acetyltransferase
MAKQVPGSAHQSAALMRFGLGWVHETACLEHADLIRLGKDAVVWAFAHLRGPLTIGGGVSIGAYCEVGPDVSVGTDTRIGARCSLFSGVSIGDRCFIGPSVTFTNDPWPHLLAWNGPGDFMPRRTTIENCATIGAGAVVLPVRIEPYAVIGAGSVVTKDVPRSWVVYGNPATWRGSVSHGGTIHQADSA